MTNISLLVSKDKYTHKIKDNILPLVIKALEGNSSLDYETQKTLLDKLKRKEYFPSVYNMLFSLSFDPKSCGIPIGLCAGRKCDHCKDCKYNPLTALLEPQLSSNSCVITDRRTIDSLFDIIILLVKANKYALLRESYTNNGIEYDNEDEYCQYF